MLNLIFTLTFNGEGTYAEVEIEGNFIPFI